jgi:hypothetical protein
MPRVRDIKTLEQLIMWAVDHESYINVWWEAQHEWNPKLEKSVEQLTHRITALERRLVFVAGGASALGSGLGLLLLRLLSG